MEPTYHNMQLVLLKKSIDETEIHNGDIIVFRCEELDAVLVKRVVGIPGQSVLIREGTLYIDGVPSSYYPEEEFAYAGLFETELVLGDKEFAVIGDNVDESKDSRYEEVGVIKRKDIKGIVLDL